MKFEDGPYYIGGKNRVDELWACMNNEVVLNDMNFNVMVSSITCEVGWYIVLAVFLNCCRHWLFLPCAMIPKETIDKEKLWNHGTWQKTTNADNNFRRLPEQYTILLHK